MAREISFDDVEPMVAAADRLREEGWDVVAADRPELGVVGFRADGPGDSVLLRCCVYGAELEPEVVVCGSWEEFVAALESRNGHEMEKSDSLSEGQVGFVTYGRSSEGRSEVFRIGVEDLRRGGAAARASLTAILLRSRLEGGPSPASGGR